MTASTTFLPTELQRSATATLGTMLPNGQSAEATFHLPVCPPPPADLKALQDAVESTLLMRPMPTKRAPTLRLAVEALKRGETPFLTPTR